MILSGYKTYISGLGFILLGVGGLLTGHVGFLEGASTITTGLVTIGARSFGQKLLDVLKDVYGDPQMIKKGESK